jgi:Domain of unknown function (DUF4214)
MFSEFTPRRRTKRSRLITPLALERLEDRTVPSTLTVTTSNDSGDGSLRAAVASANFQPGPDIIVFAPSLANQTFDLTSVDLDNDVGPAALVISSPITIEGTGQLITRVATASFRLFYVTPAGNLTLDNLTLTNGLAQGGNGGNSGTSDASSESGAGGGGAGLGGAAYNQGILTLNGCTLSGNQAVGGNGGTSGHFTTGAGGGGMGGNADATGDGGGPNGGAVADFEALPGHAGGFGGGGGQGVASGLGPTSTGGLGGAGGFGGGGGGGGDGNIPGSGILGGVGGPSGFGGGSGGGGFSQTTGDYAAGGSTGLFGEAADGNGDGGGGDGLGGAIFNQAGTLFLTNCTLTGNSATPGRTNGTASSSGFGCAVFNLNGTATLAFCTLDDDFSTNFNQIYNLSIDDPAIASQPAAMTLTNCIVFDATNGPVLICNQLSAATAATVDTTAPNLIGSQSGSGTITGSPLTKNPLLNGLAPNGGFTPTMLPQEGSPVLGAGSMMTTLTDQRGVPRSATPDLGAVEVQHPLTTVGIPSDLFTLTSPHPDASSNEAYLKALYWATFTRAADPGGLTFWMSQLTSGASSRTQVAASFYNSSENRLDQVTFFYRYFLGRAPDSDGGKYWVGKLQTGEDEGDVMSGFILSPEYTGQNDNAAFVNTMYYALLGRSSDQTGSAYWNGQLNSSALTRLQVLDEFLRSEEGIQRVIASDYVAYLRRTPSSAEVQPFAASIEAGATFGSVAEALLSSNEFFNDAASQAPTGT